MQLRFGELHWPAIAVATIVMFLIGGVWYGAVFAKTWPVLHELSEARIDSALKRFPIGHPSEHPVCSIRW